MPGILPSATVHPALLIVAAIAAPSTLVASSALVTTILCVGCDDARHALEA
jgi:hypothetical protein